MAKQKTPVKKAKKAAKTKATASKLNKILMERYGTTDVSKDNVTRALNERGLKPKDVKD